MTGKIIASANRTKTSVCMEVTPGVTPANPVWQEIFVTQNGLKLTPVRGRSKDLRSDGQAAGTFLLDATQEGSIPMELKFKMWDWLFQMTLRNSYAKKAVRDNAGVADSVITAVAAASDAYTCTDDTVDFAVGTLTLASGFGQSANNLLFRAAAGTNGTSVISPDGRADEAVPPAAAKLQAVGFEGASGDITATASGLASTTLDFTTFNIQVGEWHWIGGAAAGNKFATAADAGWARVSVIAAHALTYDVLPAGWGVDAGAGKSIQVFFPDFLPNSTTILTASFERQQLDTAAVQYEYFSGDFCNNLTWTVVGAKEIDMSADFIGLGGLPMSAVRFPGSTDLAATTYRTMTATANLGDMVEGGVSVMGGVNCFSQGTFKVTNNITRKAEPGPVGTATINVGKLMASGTFDTYLGDGTILAKGINDTLSGISWPVKYPDGNHEGYRFDFPAVRLTPTSDIPGENTGRLVSGPFEAEPHATLGYTVSVCRYWYLPA